MNIDRNAALFRQRMAQTNQNLGTVGGPPPQQNQFDPRLAVPPHRPVAVANPAPPGAPEPVTKLTGSSRRIPQSMDPTNGYKNLKRSELQSGSAQGNTNDLLEGVNRLIVGIVVILALSSGWMLQPKLKVFWLVIMSLLGLTYATLALYKEWMEVGSTNKEKAHYAEWASIMLYCLVMLFTGVTVGILFFMAWSLYSIANSKSNLARMDQPVIQEQSSSSSSSKASHGPRKQYI